MTFLGKPVVVKVSAASLAQQLKSLRLDGSD
jgi:hypothetical protein